MSKIIILFTCFFNVLNAAMTLEPSRAGMRVQFDILVQMRELTKNALVAPAFKNLSLQFSPIYDFRKGRLGRIIYFQWVLTYSTDDLDTHPLGRPFFRAELESFLTAEGGNLSPLGKRRFMETLTDAFAKLDPAELASRFNLPVASKSLLFSYSSAMWLFFLACCASYFGSCPFMLFNNVFSISFSLLLAVFLTDRIEELIANEAELRRALNHLAREIQRPSITDLQISTV